MLCCYSALRRSCCSQHQKEAIMYHAALSYIPDPKCTGSPLLDRECPGRTVPSRRPGAASVCFIFNILLQCRLNQISIYIVCVAHSFQRLILAQISTIRSTQVLVENVWELVLQKCSISPVLLLWNLNASFCTGLVVLRCCCAKQKQLNQFQSLEILKILECPVIFLTTCERIGGPKLKQELAERIH